MKEVKEPQFIGEIIGANQKEMRKGMKFYYMSKPELDYTISAIDLIPHVLEKSQTFLSDTKELENLYEYIKERSEMISRSNPYSVACALVYYLLVKNNKIENKEQFCDLVGRCPMTIMKIFKEIELLTE